MSRQKELFMVLDTETANSVEEPLPYDIGYAICDRHGNIELTRSFVVAEIFLDNKDLMQTAYYAAKIPQYWEDIKSGKRQLKSFYFIRRQIKEDMKNYNITKVGAYNMGFDKRALNNDTRYITKSFLRWFFPYGTEYFCIWNMACDTILNRPSYIKFAIKNGFVSEKGNIQTSAECAYKYLTKDTDFAECHTGLEDVLIEVAIMAYCYRQHKKFDNSINSSCWRKVQKAKKQVLTA
jgi:hypothetical protein